MTPCLDCGGAIALPGAPRCHKCHRKRRRATYDSPAYRAWGRPTGTCQLQILCDGAPATSWDHADGNATNHHILNRLPSCLRCNSSKGARPQ